MVGQQRVRVRVQCERILKERPELFTFVADPRVPAVNNAAERNIRPIVGRKISGGTHSAAGTLPHTPELLLQCRWFDGPLKRMLV